jgi:hypothetical protein
MANTVHVGNLPSDTSDVGLGHLLAPYPGSRVLSLKRPTEDWRFPYAFLTFVDVRGGQAAAAGGARGRCGLTHARATPPSASAQTASARSFIDDNHSREWCGRVITAAWAKGKRPPSGVSPGHSPGQQHQQHQQQQHQHQQPLLQRPLSQPSTIVARPLSRNVNKVRVLQLPSGLTWLELKRHMSRSVAGWGGVAQG